MPTTAAASRLARVIIMDAGQSGVRTRLDETVLDEQPGVRTSLPIIPQLAAATRQALAQAGTTTDALAVGSTALRGDASAAELLRQVAFLGIKRVALTHDSVTSHIGALRGARGAIVAAGTGVVTLAVGAASVARVDGWGNIIGDAGSGFWIGRAGLDAVMRAHDGRGPSTALTATVRRDFKDLEAAYLDLQNDPRHVPRIAAYAKTIAHLAGTDAVCASIVDEAASELAHSCVTALRQVGEEHATRFSALGNVFLNTRLKARFNNLVREAIPDARSVAPQGDGLAGAAMLFKVPARSPLRSQISFASY